MLGKWIEINSCQVKKKKTKNYQKNNSSNHHPAIQITARIHPLLLPFGRRPWTTITTGSEFRSGPLPPPNQARVGLTAIEAWLNGAALLLFCYFFQFIH